MTSPEASSGSLEKTHHRKGRKGCAEVAFVSFAVKRFF